MSHGNWPAASPRPYRRAEEAAARWVIGVVAVQVVCQLALIAPGLQSGRVVFRTAAFLGSIAALALVPAGRGRHPSWYWLLAALALLTLQFFSPTTNSPLSGLASIGLNVAIFAPIVWAVRLRVTPRLLVQALGLIWAFQTASASAGVLQALYPGQFMPQAAEAYEGLRGEAMLVVLADGSSIFRPMGLTDTPGGAAPAGLMAYLLGLGFLTNSRSVPLRLVAIGSMMAGLFCMILCQVRVTVVLSALMTLGYVALLFAQNRLTDLLWVAALLPFVVTGGAGYALSVGGESTLRRLESLIEDDPNSIYYRNRGVFLERTFDEGIEDYPFGAGLGRWGMMNTYFGDQGNPAAPPLWVEIQWTAWLYDGGVPMMVAYAGALLVAALATLRVATTARSPTIAGWAAVLCAYNLGVIAVTFSYVPFIGQMGLEFWLLNATLYAAARHGGPGARPAARGVPA